MLGEVLHVLRREIVEERNGGEHLGSVHAADANQTGPKTKFFEAPATKASAPTCDEGPTKRARRDRVPANDCREGAP